MIYKKMPVIKCMKFFTLKSVLYPGLGNPSDFSPSSRQVKQSSKRNLNVFF